MTGTLRFGDSFNLAKHKLGKDRFGADLIYPTLRVGPPFSLRVRVLTYPNPFTLTLILRNSVVDLTLQY